MFPRDIRLKKMEELSKMDCIFLGGQKLNPLRTNCECFHNVDRGKFKPTSC